MIKPLYDIPQDWSIPSKNLRPLLDALKADMSKSGIAWDGASEALKKFLVEMSIDPKIDIRYQHFFVSRRHTAATSYTWRGTNLYQMAVQAELAENVNDLLFIDVLVVNQGSISSSAQVIGTTDSIYCNCKVLVFLDDDYLGRAWCLAECGQYTRPESSCVLVVYGKAEFKPSSDFLREMKAGVPADLPLIESYILDKFQSKEAFNQAIDRAIVMLSPLSLLYQGRYSEAKIACEEQIRMLKDSKCENSAALTKATVTMAKVLWRLGHLAAATEHLTSALEMCAESELELRGDVMNMSGNVLLDQGKYGEALNSYEKSLDLRVRCFGTVHVAVADTQNNIAMVLEKQGKFDEALVLYYAALKTTIGAVGEDHHASVALTYMNMGNVYDSLGKFEKALEMHQKALDIQRQALGDRHADVATTQNNIGEVYRDQGKLVEALQMYEQCLATFETSLGPDHLSVANMPLNNMGLVFCELGHFEKALAHHERALQIKIKSVGERHAAVADTYLNMGVVQRRLGDLQKALELYEKALEIYLQCYGPSHVSVANTKYNIALLYRRQGSDTEARNLFHEAAAVYTTVYGANHSETVDALNQAKK